MVMATEVVDWLLFSVGNGVADDVILTKLKENGFSNEAAEYLLRKTKKDKKPVSIDNSYVNYSHNHIYNLSA